MDNHLLMTFIDMTMTSIRTKQDIWGGGEAIELQVLLMVDMMYFVSQEKTVRASRLWLEYVGKNVDREPVAQYLHTSVSKEELVNHLYAFYLECKRDVGNGKQP